MDSISRDTTVVPVDSMRQDASGTTKLNQLFQGLPYPDKLESYIHGMVRAAPSLLLKPHKLESCSHGVIEAATALLQGCLYMPLLDLGLLS